MSSSIDDDSFFVLMMTNCWSLNQSQDPYANLQKGWSAQNPAKPGKVMEEKTPLFHEDKPVQRSGQVSSKNPLSTTSHYYKPSYNASKDNLTSQVMHGGPPKNSEVVQNYQAAIREQIDY